MGINADYIDLDCQPTHVGGHRNPFAAYRSVPAGEQSHRTLLAGDWETYYATKRSGQTRRKDRKRLKKLCDYGDVAFQIVSAPADVRRMMDRLIVEKVRQFKALGVDNIFGKDGVADLFSDVAMRQAPSGSVKLFAVTLNGDPVAIAYCVVHQDEIHGVFLCYAERDVTHLSPGTLLLHRMFAWSFANGIASFDFSIGDQDYKDHWCETTNPLRRSLWPITPRGALFVRSVNMATCLKATVKASPALANLARRLQKLG